VAFTTLPQALITHLQNTQQAAPVSDAASGGPGAPVPAASQAAAQVGPIKYPLSTTPGPDDAWQAANLGPWNGYTPNAGQVDNYGNVYVPVQAGAWGGGYVNPGSLPGRSTTNAQLWGGPQSDSPPAWLQTIVQKALGMTGSAQAAYEKHIMDSMLTPTLGANAHDLGYVERMFGIQ
jgi:hypothetical protein